MAALARYGVDGLQRTPELEAAVVWMFRSFSRVGELIPVVMSILERRLRRRRELAPLADEEMRARFDRLAASAQIRHQAIAELAHDVVFRYFDEPVLEALVESEDDATERALAAVEADPGGPGSAEAIERLVDSPHPQRGALLRHWLDTSDPDFRKVLLEVYARRYYRIRELRDLRVRRARRPAAVRRRLRLGEQAHPPRRRLRRAVAGCPRWPAPWPSTCAACRRTDRSPSTWPPGARGPHTGVEETAPVVEELLARCDFGRVPWRVDVTVTTTDGDEAEHVRTLHLSYRPKAGGGLLEDPLYRNLHPMLAKRLDLWRLANFRLERLASAEDVYLFHGVAHDNPKDTRLFALAEVRDLTPVLDPTGARSYPWLGRMGVQCLAAMRAALASFPRARAPHVEPDRALRPAAVGRAARLLARPRPHLRAARRGRRPRRRCCCGSGSPSRTGR